MSTRWRFAVRLLKTPMLVTLCLEKEPLVPTKYNDVWAPELVLTIWRKEKYLARNRNQTPDCPVHSKVTVLTELPWLPKVQVGRVDGVSLTTMRLRDVLRTSWLTQKPTITFSPSILCACPTVRSQSKGCPDGGTLLELSPSFCSTVSIGSSPSASNLSAK
jgi:hypothetical protein